MPDLDRIFGKGGVFDEIFRGKDTPDPSPKYEPPVTKVTLSDGDIEISGYISSIRINGFLIRLPEKVTKNI